MCKTRKATEKQITNQFIKKYSRSYNKFITGRFRQASGAAMSASEPDSKVVIHTNSLRQN